MTHLYIDADVVTDMTWNYVQERPALQRLYEQGKVSQWNATTDIDWSPGVEFGSELPDRRHVMGIKMPGSPIHRFGDDLGILGLEDMKDSTADLDTAVLELSPVT